MSARVIAGVVLVILGIGALLDQFTTFDFGGFISDWWPMLVVLVGVVQLITRSAPLAGALVVIVAGLVLEAGALELLPVDFWDLFWPVILIAVGASLLLPRALGHREAVRSEDTVSYFTAFGGREDRLASSAFQGGTVTALFGGAELDLRDATLAAEGATMDVTAAFGGVEIAVPQDWVVEISGIPLFGGWGNKTVTHRKDAPSPSVVGADRKNLRIKAFVAFGGLEVKN
jgi:predicted membrane protein